MSERPPAGLAALLRPRAMAVMGAAGPAVSLERPNRYLQAHGIAGRIVPVNPQRREVAGLPSVPSLASVLLRWSRLATAHAGAIRAIEIDPRLVYPAGQGERAFTARIEKPEMFDATT